MHSPKEWSKPPYHNKLYLHWKYNETRNKIILNKIAFNSLKCKNVQCFRLISKREIEWKQGKCILNFKID